MTIVQEAFDVPDDIMAGILTGEFKRVGGVVRQASGPENGQIVKLLDPVELKDSEQTQSVSAKAGQFVAENKTAVIIAGVAATAAIGIGIYQLVKKHKPKVVAKFQASLKTYINALRFSNLKVEEINALMSSLEEIKKHKDYEKIRIQLSTEELDILVNHIYEYSMKLAKVNFVELTEEERVVEQGENSTIINLQRCLKTQKRIFEEAA